MPKKDVPERWVLVDTPPEAWPVDDDVIECKGEALGYLRSKKAFRNFILEAEWRFKKEGWIGAPEKWPNAGLLILASEGFGKRRPKSSVEVQGHDGEKGSLFSGGIQRAKRGPIMKDRVAFGDWDRYEVTARNGHVRVVLNGKLVNEGWDADPREGFVCFQSEGWPVLYRNVRIKVLPD